MEGGTRLGIRRGADFDDARAGHDLEFFSRFHIGGDGDSEGGCVGGRGGRGRFGGAGGRFGGFAGGSVGIDAFGWFFFAVLLFGVFFFAVLFGVLLGAFFFGALLFGALLFWGTVVFVLVLVGLGALEAVEHGAVQVWTVDEIQRLMPPLTQDVPSLCVGVGEFCNKKEYLCVHILYSDNFIYNKII